MRNNNNEIRQAALDYLKRGYSVLPINPENKRPLVAWKDYQTTPPTKVQVHEWYEQFPNAMIGIITGKVSDLCVLDADDKRALEAFIRACDPDVYQQLPMVKTPGNDQSYHFYFKRVEGLSVATKVEALGGMDFRGEGGYVIAPPSINKNDEKYQWFRGHSLDDKIPPPMPSELVEILIKATRGQPLQMDLNNQRETTGETFRDGGHWYYDGIVPQGMRDDTLFHLAHHLKNGKMLDDEIISFLTLFSKELCEHTGDDPEPQEKLQSVLDRAKRISRNITDEVRRYIFEDIQEGDFSYSQIYSDLAITEPKDKDLVRKCVRTLVDEGIVEKIQGKSRVFTFVSDEINEIDFLSADTEPIDMWLPFALNDMINVYDGNTMVVAGEPNSGKTALMLNIIKENMDKFNQIRYLNSEMGAAELRKRLEKFEDMSLNDWKFQAINRASNFHKVLLTGAGNLNVIDFLELVDNFYEVNKFLSYIHEKLDGAVAVVSIQKDSKMEVGRGGSFGLEKPKLYLTLGNGAARIIKAKDWSKVRYNPNGKVLDFKLVQGYKFISDNQWRNPIDKQIK